MGSYSISLNNTTKVLSVNLEGVFTEPDALAYINEFNKNVKSIIPKEYDLSFDAKNLKVSPQEMLPLLEQCFKMYKEIGFKNIIMDMGTSPVLKMQVKRIANNSGLNNCTII